MPNVPQKRFNAIWCYPWDLVAEGLDESLGRIADLGITALSLAVSYHSGMLLLPHNPQQKVRILEDGSLYFRPRGKHFRRLAIQPRISALADKQDPLERILTGAQRHGLEVVAWTVCCHNSYQGERHLDLAIHNAFGDPYPYALCPAQPAVQDYLEALVRELGAYPLRFIQLEACEYMGFPHGHHHEKVMVDLTPLGRMLMGLCFCPACRAAASAQGADYEAARAGVERYIVRAMEGEADPTLPATRGAASEVVPELEPYFEMRDSVESQLVLRLGKASSRPLSLLRAVPYIAAVAPALGEVTHCVYRIGADEVTTGTRAARAIVGPSMRLSIGLEASPLFSPSAENLAAKVRAAREAGADGLYFYNYGLMPLRSLGWLRSALKG